MATKQKLTKAIAKAVHKHNMSRFEAFYEQDTHVVEPSRGELIKLIHGAVKQHPDLLIFLKNPKASVVFNENATAEMFGVVPGRVRTPTNFKKVTTS
jgi:hypothetical protein